MWNRSFQEHFQQGKRTIGHMWNHAVKFAGQLDHTMNVGRRAFGALQDLAPSNVSGAVMRGFDAYGQGRGEVLGMHNKVQSSLDRLKKAAPELDLD